MLFPNARRPVRRVGVAVAFLAIVVALLVGPGVVRAYAAGTAATFVVDANLNADGTLKVRQTITFAGTPPPEISQRFETVENLVGDRQYAVSLSEFAATVARESVAPQVENEGRFTTITVPTNGASELTMSYTVRGAVVNTGTGTAMRWRLLQGLSASVTSFEATVQTPTIFDYLRCTAGGPNSTTPCAFAAGGTQDAQVPTFRDGPRGEGEVVAVDIGFAAGAVTANEQIQYRWTIGRAFSPKPLPLSLALGLLVLGGAGLLALHRRAGVDRQADGELSRAGEFVPTGPGTSEFRVVSDIRPGHVGTVADERVDPIDITGTLLDLAVRGHLVITELPRTSPFAPTDWELTRHSGADELRPFEEALLTGVMADAKAVRVSGLGNRVQESISGVQDALYDEMVAYGWFERRPDATRNTWMQLAIGGLIAALVITGLLAAFTTFGLIGLALIALALGLLFVAQEMPARTRKGSALLAGLGALRSDLLSHPTNQMAPGTELREMSQVLPYAVVLGGVDRWLDAIVASDGDDTPDSTELGWYRGPADWHLRHLPASLRNFITTVSGTLFAR